MTKYSKLLVSLIKTGVQTQAAPAARVMSHVSGASSRAPEAWLHPAKGKGGRPVRAGPVTWATPRTAERLAREKQHDDHPSPSLDPHWPRGAHKRLLKQHHKMATSNDEPHMRELGIN